MSDRKAGSKREGSKRRGGSSTRGSSRASAGSNRASKSSRGSRRGPQNKRSSQSSRGSRGSRRDQSNKSLMSGEELGKLFVSAGKKFGVDGKLRVKASAEKERDVVHAAVMHSFKVQPSPPGAPRPEDVDLGILTTAPIETLGVMSALRGSMHYDINLGISTWDCYVGTLFGVRAVVVKSDQGPSGSHGSINATSLLVSEWGVKTIWAVGIALGADPKGQKHGDVLAATAVQVYETKVRTGKDGKKNITLSHAPWTVAEKHKSVVESTCATWKNGDNKGHAGLVVSAPKLLDDAGATTEQLNVVRKAVPKMPVIGGEMEMGGVISVCLGAGVPWGVVKGICDFGGLDKAKSKEWQPLATMNAVAWMGAAIGNGAWIKDLASPALSALHVMSFDEYMEKKRDGFVGRTELFGKMEAFSGGRVLLIKGEAGIGKSALMSQFVARNEDNGKIMALHFCQFGDGSTLDSERWLRSVTGQIMRWASQHSISIPDEVIERLLDDSKSVQGRFDEFSRAFPKTAPSGTGSVWVVVDSLDEAVQAGGHRSGFDIVRAIGRAQFPSWIRIVASTRSDPTVMSALEREIKNVVVMESSSEENMRDLRTWLTTAGGVTKESTLKAVLDASGGNFLYVRQLVVDGDLEKRVNSLPSGLVGIYSARAKALWEDVDEFEGDVPVLSVLVAARAPVPLDLLKAAVKVGGGRVNVKRVVKALDSVLDSGKDGAVRVFHKSFVDWCVSVGYEGVKAEPHEGHKGLAKAGKDMWKDGVAYAVRHTVAHAKEGGLEKIQKSVGLNWNWMTLRAGIDNWAAVEADVGGSEANLIKLSRGEGIERVARVLALHGGSEIRSKESGLEKALIAWPLETHELKKSGDAVITRWKAVVGDQAQLRDLCWLPALEILVTAEWYGDHVRVWKDDGDWSLVGDVKTGFTETRDMAVLNEKGNKDGLVVLVCNRGVAVLSVPKMKIVYSVKDEAAQRCESAAWVTPKRFVTGSEGHLTMWEVGNKKPVWSAKGVGERVTLLSDGRLAVAKYHSPSDDPKNPAGTLGYTNKDFVENALSIVDPKSGKVVKQTRLRANNFGLTALSSGRVADHNGSIGIHVGLGKKSVHMERERQVWAVAALEDGNTLVSMDHEGSLVVWDSSSGECKGLAPAKVGLCRCVTSLGKGRAASGGTDGSVVVWNTADAGKPPAVTDPYKPAVGGPSPITAAGLDKSGHVVTGHMDGSVSWAGGKSKSKASHEKQVNCLVTLPKGGWVTGGADGTVRVWSAKGEPGVVFKGHKAGEVKKMVVVKKGDVVVSGDTNGRIVWWHVKDGSVVGEIVKPNPPNDPYASIPSFQGVNAMCVVDPAEKTVAVGFMSSPMVIIDLEKKKEVLSLGSDGMEMDGMNVVMFDSKYASSIRPMDGGKKLIGFHSNGTRVWDLSKPTKPVAQSSGANWKIPFVELKPGVFLAYGTPQGRTVCIWSSKTMKPIKEDIAEVPVGSIINDVVWDASHQVFHIVTYNATFAFKLKY